MPDQNTPSVGRSADSALSEYLGVVAHRLHTPITAIRWLVESFLDGTRGKLTEEQREGLEEIRQGVESLNEFSRAILAVYELEKDLPMIQPQDLLVGDLLRRVAKNLAPLIVEYKGRVVPDAAVDTVSITADPDVAFTILRTFLENALRYSPAGSEFPVRIAQRSKETVITVEDHGCGIPSDAKPHIGMKFFRTSQARRLWTDGVGLNLSIAMNLARRTGGGITFESEEGKGSFFHWHVPIVLAARKQPWEGKRNMEKLLP